MKNIVLKFLTFSFSIITTSCYMNTNLTSLNAENLAGENHAIISDPTTPQPETPVPEEIPAENPFLIFADEMSTCLLKDKKLICSGENAQYQKLNGLTTIVTTPILVNAISEDIISYETGSNFSCVLLSNHKVKCWGTNDLGQLGNGTNIASPTPVEVINLENVSKITLGWKHACALLEDGGVKCWGDNNSGELGRGYTTASGGQHSPEYVSGFTSGVSDISAGTAKAEHTCALIADGIKCWGYNAWGQLGTGASSSKNVPTDVVGLANPGSGVLKIVPNRYTTCAVLTGNRMNCWGYNDYGQLGNNNLGTNSLLPVNVDLSGLSANETVVNAAQGEEQVCLLTDKGSVYCWGRDHAGQLGDGIIGGTIAKPTITLLTTGVKQLSMGRYHGCATMVTNQEAFCWGLNNMGQLGQGNTTNSATPLVFSLPL